MFKKRSKARQATASPREQRQASPKLAEEPNQEPLARKQPSHERTKLSLEELHLRYGNGQEPKTETYEELDDDWEDEQLRKNGVTVDKPVRSAMPGDDQFADVKERIKTRIHSLHIEAESLERALQEDDLF